MSIEDTMEIRKFHPGEEHEIWLLFYNTIHNINARDYNPEQLDAWAPQDMDLETVYQKIRDIDPFVVIVDEKIVAYADVQSDGYIDHFFCHHDYNGKGIGRSLFSQLLQTATENGATRLYANVSITARPFFESMGFAVDEEQRVQRRGQAFTNFRMSRQLDSGQPGDTNSL